MKSLFTRGYLAFSLCILMACKNESKDLPQESITVNEKTTTTPEESTNLITENTLRLNNGERWEANTETTNGVKNMMIILNDFVATDNTEAYAELTEGLKQEFAIIFEKCTMKGEAHNQLHNFLIPINNEFDNLSSSNVETCKASFNRLNEHLKSYPIYFK